MDDESQGKRGARGMDDPVDPSRAPWTASRSTKERNAVARNVTALLDELAPEKVLTRGDRLKVRIEEHRTPTGCVLQAPGAALSVSWFGDPDKAIGELHIVVWRGVVSRRGAPPRKEGAEITKELVLHPMEPPVGDHVWRAADGSEYDTASLAAYCLALLEEQITAG